MSSHVPVPGAAVAQPANQFITSGVSPASAVSGVGALSGPFWIQEQTLQYDYVRVPMGSLSSVVLSLSGSTWTAVHTGTVIIIRCKATVSTRKSYEWFETSAYTQPQRFAVEAASADMFGTTYCPATLQASACAASSLSGTYMCAGQVYTYQPWYRRRPWKRTDTETNHTEIGYNYQAYNDNGPIPDGQTGEGAQDAEKVWADYQSTFATDTLDGTNGLTVLLKFPVAEKSGTYTYAQDDDNDIMYNTDMLGPAWNMGGFHDQFGVQTMIFPYDSNRHDWS